MTDARRRKLERMTEEERVEHRKSQLLNAQRRYRETHGLIKPPITPEERLRTKKERAHEYYLKRKEAKAPEKELKEKKPESYTIEYQREYHKNYYKENKENVEIVVNKVRKELLVRRVFWVIRDLEEIKESVEIRVQMVILDLWVNQDCRENQVKKECLVTEENRVTRDQEDIEVTNRYRFFSLE